MMEFSLFKDTDTDVAVELFTRVFAASEGDVEGESIGELVTNLIATTPDSDLIGCIAKDGSNIVGGIFFSRFIVPSDELAFMLSPVAVATDVQGTGIGQQLLRYGLDHLKSEGVELVITYGNPAYYSKVGFEQITADVIQPPFPLSQPIGWLAQSLSGRPIKAMSGATKVVEAFNDPKYW